MWAWYLVVVGGYRILALNPPDDHQEGSPEHQQKLSQVIVCHYTTLVPRLQQAEPVLPEPLRNVL